MTLDELLTTVNEYNRYTALEISRRWKSGDWRVTLNPAEFRDENSNWVKQPEFIGHNAQALVYDLVDWLRGKSVRMPHCGLNQCPGPFVKIPQNLESPFLGF